MLLRTTVLVRCPALTNSMKSSTCVRRTKVMTTPNRTSESESEHRTLRRSKRLRISKHEDLYMSSPTGSLATDDASNQDSDFDPAPLGAHPSDTEEDNVPSVLQPRALKTRRPATRGRRPGLTDLGRGHILGSTSSRDTRRTFAEDELAELRTRLLEWYVDNHRALPWRPPPRYQKGGVPPQPLPEPGSPSSPGAPYAVWISEVMSQQTRIQVVVDYYNRWIREFPTIRHLADASLNRVNELWAGLGYYRRARFLHEGARQVIDKHNGVIPADVASLRKLKGIGRYTAGAISSIAFGRDEPVVDGNVERVFSRLLPALTQGASQVKSLSDEFWDLASSCVRDIECAGDFNQALMEFGSTVCKPKAVRCHMCPLQSMCGAYAEAERLQLDDPATYVTRYPVKNPKKVTKVRDESVIALVVCTKTEVDRRFLVLQRPGTGLLAGLWEAPNKVLRPSVSGDETACLNELAALLEEVIRGRGNQLQHTSLTTENCVHVKTVRHIFSHIRQSLDVKLLTIPPDTMINPYQRGGKTSSGLPYRWVSEEELADGAVSTQMKKVFAAALVRLRET